MSFGSLLKTAVALALVLALLYRINIADLLAVFSSVNLHYLSISFVVGFVGFIMTSALRWRAILFILFRVAIPYSLALRYYWEGLFMGYFVPGGIGADIYRALAAGRKTGAYQKNIACVAGEKIYILVDSIIFVLVLLPFVQASAKDTVLLEAMHSYFFTASSAVLVIILVIIVLFTLRNTGIISGLFVRFTRMAELILRRIPGFTSSLSAEKSPADLILPFTRPSSIALLFMFTLLNRTVLCTGGYFLLKSVDAGLPLLINFFVWTMMSILFSLPISVGTVGVREWVHILLLGLFGINAESALAVSFIGLGCLLLSTLIGGLILFVFSFRKLRS